MIKQLTLRVSAAGLSVALLMLGSAASWADTPGPGKGSSCYKDLLDPGKAVLARLPEQKEMLTQHWKETRALYQRDLDYQRTNSERWSGASDFQAALIESKYQLTLAKGRLLGDQFDRQAVANLEQADAYLNRALKDDKTQHQAKIQQVKREVGRVAELIRGEGGCWSMQLDNAFLRIDRGIEQLLHSS